jgi:hypothetical protein
MRDKLLESMNLDGQKGCVSAVATTNICEPGKLNFSGPENRFQQW